MKIKHIFIFIALASLALQSCDDGYEHYEGVYITGTLGNNPKVSLTVDDNFPKSVDFIVGSSSLVEKDITIELSVNGSVLDEYNKKFESNYVLLPENCYIITHPTVVIEKGNYATTMPVKLNIISTEGMSAASQYMVPVSIAKVSDGYRTIEASRTVFVELKQIVVQNALDIGTNHVYTQFWAPLGETKPCPYDTRALQKVTFEMRCNIRFLHTKSFNSLMGSEENLLIRTNTFDDGSGVLDACGGGMGNIKSAERFPEEVWTHVAMTYDDGTEYLAIYIDGEQVGGRTVSRNADLRPIDLCKGYDSTTWQDEWKWSIGFSRDSRSLNGYVSEARVWATVRTPAEIRNNMCAVDPQATGLVAYWKFNERLTEGVASGMYEDLTGHGFHMRQSSSSTYGWMENVRCPEE